MPINFSSVSQAFDTARSTFKAMATAAAPHSDAETGKRSSSPMIQELAEDSRLDITDLVEAPRPMRVRLGTLVDAYA